MQIFVFAAELILLSFLSRSVSQQLFLFFLVLFGSRSVALSAITLLLFPGTVIHELSHLFVAEILGVRTGKLTLVPEGLEGQEGEIQTGSVAVAKADPFRRTLIGLAPLFVGIGILSAVSFLFKENINNINIITFITFYIMFAVSNSMFASREDMKGVVPFLITISLFIGAGYVAGLRFSLTGKILEATQQVLTSLNQSLLLVLAVNILLLLIIKILIRIKRLIAV